MKVPPTREEPRRFDPCPLDAPRLAVELVPATAWYANLRTILPKEEWNRLRRSVYEKAGHRCEICGGVGPRHPVECHEVWSWIHRKETNSIRGGQRLVRVQALCPACHEVKHFGLAQVRGRDQEAMRHLARVNGWSVAQGQLYVARMFEEWAERSTFKWVLLCRTLEPVLREHLPDFKAVLRW